MQITAVPADLQSVPLAVSRPAEPMSPVSLLQVCALAMRIAEPEAYDFTAGKATITLQVRFLEPYVGQPLTLYEGDELRRDVCASLPGAVCPQRFVGAVAIGTFTVRAANGRPLSRSAIREYVTVVAQSADLPARPPFSKTQPLTRGVASDVQVFGYDETPIPEEHRAALREQSREQSWVIYRQQLYLDADAEAFAVIDWRHTIDGLEILRVQGRTTERAKNER